MTEEELREMDGLRAWKEDAIKSLIRAGFQNGMLYTEMEIYRDALKEITRWKDGVQAQIAQAALNKAADRKEEDLKRMEGIFKTEQSTTKEHGNKTV